MDRNDIIVGRVKISKLNLRVRVIIHLFIHYLIFIFGRAYVCIYFLSPLYYADYYDYNG